MSPSEGANRAIEDLERLIKDLECELEKAYRLLDNLQELHDMAESLEYRQQEIRSTHEN
jgi:hypothetical protein